jgi:CBS domain-containing protein
MKTHVDPNIFLTYRAKDIQTKMSNNPTCVDINESLEDALSKLDAKDYDQAPVVSNQVVIGWVLRRELHGANSLGNVLHQLSHRDLISDEAPLDDALQRLIKQELIFTIGAEGVVGFIVRSDIERHVSRAHMYLLISGLEILMTRHLELENENFDTLESFMSKDSRAAWLRARESSLDANPIEYLDTFGLAKALSSNQRIMNHIAMKKQDWLNYMYTLKQIRNWVAHGNTQELTAYPFVEIVHILKKAEEIVKRLNSY